MQGSMAGGAGRARTSRTSVRLVIAAGAAVSLVASMGAMAANAASVSPARSSAPGTLTRAQAAELSTNVNQHVIVVMKSQLAQAAVGSRAAGARAAAVRSSQAALVSELSEVHATNVRQYSLVNAVAATVSSAEESWLRADSSVAEVVPDATITVSEPTTTTTTTTSATPSKVKTSLKPHVIPGACSKTPQLDSEGLTLTNTASYNKHQKTARSLGFTGAGVKVAWIADGLDPNNINFIRRNHTSVFDQATGGDYEDFTGLGLGAQTGGDEAFLDANTIAGQGLHTYNVNPYGAQPYKTPCNVRIEGVAPGASLDGFDVFAEAINPANPDYYLLDTTESNFVEAINYAVETDHVNVINESFGGNVIPDIASLDLVSLFDEAAVNAGVVVVASSGDAGSTGTIGAPATDPAVIAAGGSTDDRYYAQTNYAAARYFATKGWLDDNISALSSGGTDETNGTVDLVAPAEVSWASCQPDPALYYSCVTETGKPSDIEESGGTSESSPFIAGAAALVIQAYRHTHHNADPTPAQVKQILMSTATDLGTPADEQGAGLLNSYKAVELAESISTGHRVGDTLLVSPTSLNATGGTGSSHKFPVTITNTGAQTQVVKLAGRTFGANENTHSGKITLKDGVSPQFANYQGIQNNYGVFHFKVTRGQDRLAIALDYPGNQLNCNLFAFCDGDLNDRVRVILVDPRGRFASHSFPQGPGNHDLADVRYPTAGTWTGVIFGDIKGKLVDGQLTPGGTNGTVRWQVSTEKFARFGSVSPSKVTLAPGHSRTVVVTERTPAQPGDASGSIVLTSNRGGVDSYLGAESNSIPVTLRSLINVAAGGNFSGTLTGGNGRAPGEGQEEFYEFNVPTGVHSITANLLFKNDPTDPAGAYLVNPDGAAVAVGQNSFCRPATCDTPTAELFATNGVTATTLNPEPGTWTLLVDFAGAVVGNEISEPFVGNVAFNDVTASATGLPDSASVQLPASTPVTVPVKYTNNTAAVQELFADGRLDTATSQTLSIVSPTTATVPLPMTGTTYGPTWLVPTETSSISVSQTSTVNGMFDLGYNDDDGDPDLPSMTGTSALCGTSASASWTPAGGTVSQGYWATGPTECGPFTSAASTGSATDTMTAVTKPFDPAVTSVTGDFWEESIDPSAASSFAPVEVDPGQTVTIDVTITPSPSSVGSVISGTLYLDDYNWITQPYFNTDANELAAFPYEYTVASGG
jgi:subtilase family protein